MYKSFLRLSADEKLKIFGHVARVNCRAIRFLEKDAWDAWTVREIFSAPFGKHLLFKNGTSLSKGYDAIRRYAKDVDLTYDIRTIMPDMVNVRKEI